jgi:type I restriction enzyme S subunit
MADVMAEFYDGPHATPKPADAGGVYLGIKNLTDSGHLDLSQVRFIAEHDIPRWTKRVTPREGDIVFSYEATLHRYAVIPSGFHGTLGRRLALIRVAEDVMRRDFLLYTFLSPQWRRVIESRMNIGSTVDRIPLTEFPKYPIAIPPLSSQDGIVGVLRGFDDLIENNRRRIEILEEMARLLYREWFVHFRFPGYEDVELVDSELGPIPEGWESRTLGEVAENFDRKRVPLSKMQRAEMQGPYPYYGAAKIFDYVDDYIFDGEYLLLGEDGTVVDGAGGPMLQLANGKFWCNNHAHVLRGTDVSTRRLWCALRGYPIAGHVTGAAQPKITQANMNRIPILVPPAAVADEFDAAIDPMIDLWFNLDQQNRVLREARDLLLPRLVSGELDVSELDEDGVLA